MSPVRSWSLAPLKFSALQRYGQTALSPLVIGGIIAAIPMILLTACSIYNSVKEGEFSKRDLFGAAVLCVASAAIGVGLAAAATAIFPGAMLGIQSVALIGAAIGAIVPIVANLTMNNIIVPIAKKVDEHIISPIAEKIFPSKGEGYE